MPRIQRISMQDVADRAGVSRMTVSRALRNHREVSPAMRRRIAEVAAEMGYRANPMVSALMANLRASKNRSGTETIAFLTTHDSPETWRRIPILQRFFTGAAARASELGFELEEFCLPRSGMTEGRLSRMLWARNIQGILVAPAPHPGYRLALEWERFASVAIGFSVIRPNLHRIANHQIHSLRAALKEACALGYRRPGLVMEREHDQRVDHNWEMAFLEFQNRAPRSARIPILNPETVAFGDFRKWFLRHRPDVVLATTTKARAQITGWLDGLGMGVPDDVGFISLNKDRRDDDTSGIDQNPELVGEAAIELLAEQLYHNNRGLPKAPKVVLIEGCWVEGKTVRRVARESPHSPSVPAGGGISQSSATPPVR